MMGLLSVFSEKLRNLFFGREDFNEEFVKYINRKCAGRVVRYNAYSKGYVDVRRVFDVSAEEEQEMREYFLKVVEGVVDNDERALLIVKHINSRMTYVHDVDNFGFVEYWASPYQIFKSWRDDCDGYAVLTVFAWGLVGIPSGRRYVLAGDVFFSNGSFAGGHAVAVYWSERFNELFALEGSFYPVLSLREYERLPLRLNKRYGRSWFFTNERDSYFDILSFWR
jgi:hypothetical protein